MKRFSFAILTFLLLASLVAFIAKGTSTQADEAPALNKPIPQVEMGFEALQIYIDTQDSPLAAYQLDFKATRGKVQITGIEGADAGSVFHEPPYYDAKAMQKNHVKLADFSTANSDKLPKGKTRIATVMIMIEAGDAPTFELTLTTAADENGKVIPAKLTLKRGNE